MTVYERLNIERARLGWKLPTTPKQVEAVEAAEKNDREASFPNASKPVIMKINGEPTIVALHRFEDQDVWLVRLHDHSDDWVTVRRATDVDKDIIATTIQAEMRRNPSYPV